MFECVFAAEVIRHFFHIMHIRASERISLVFKSAFSGVFCL